MKSIWEAKNFIQLICSYFFYVILLLFSMYISAIKTQYIHSQLTWHLTQYVEKKNASPVSEQHCCPFKNNDSHIMNPLWLSWNTASLLLTVAASRSGRFTAAHLSKSVVLALHVCLSPGPQRSELAARGSFWLRRHLHNFPYTQGDLHCPDKLS